MAIIQAGPSHFSTPLTSATNRGKMRREGSLRIRLEKKTKGKESTGKPKPPILEPLRILTQSQMIAGVHIVGVGRCFTHVRKDSSRRLHLKE